uniref:Uncharacterized protein n=1 Tax=Acrobeloides nanus TaxID=290746 RepID=A0A914DMS4_9BILA
MITVITIQGQGSVTITITETITETITKTITETITETITITEITGAYASPLELMPLHLFLAVEVDVVVAAEEVDAQELLYLDQPKISAPLSQGYNNAPAPALPQIQPAPQGGYQQGGSAPPPPPPPQESYQQGGSTPPSPPPPPPPPSNPGSYGESAQPAPSSLVAPAPHPNPGKNVT